jgi:hypothetical protein
MTAYAVSGSTESEARTPTSSLRRLARGASPPPTPPAPSPLSTPVLPPRPLPTPSPAAALPAVEREAKTMPPPGRVPLRKALYSLGAAAPPVPAEIVAAPAPAGA